MLSSELSMAGPAVVAQETSPWIVLLGGSVVLLNYIKYLFPVGWRWTGCLLIYADNVPKREDYRENKA